MDWQLRRLKTHELRNFRTDEDFNTIRSQLLSSGKLFEDTVFPSTPPGKLEWRRPKEICDRPKFIDDRASRFDALQGEAGDCWLVCVMETLTLKYITFQYVVPTDQSFYDNYVGAFHFRIWQLGQWYDVVVDDRLPYNIETSELEFVRSRSGDVFWAALLEKAYCKVCGTSKQAYYDRLNKGITLTSMQDLSGGIVETIGIVDPKRDLSFRKLFYEISRKAVMMTTGFFGKGEAETDYKFEPANLFQNHSYAITRTHKWDDDDDDYHGLFLVRLMNTLGMLEWQLEFADHDYDRWKQIDPEWQVELEFVVDEDGEFWMNEEDVEKWFEAVDVCYLSPIEYAEVYCVDEGLDRQMDHWNELNLHGEWVVDISDGGSDLSTRHMNPQFAIRLEHPEKHYETYPVVIEITHRSKRERRIFLKIAFYIYRVDPLEKYMPLDHDYLQKVDPIEKNPEFNRSSYRAYLKAFKLEPGFYCILPCTEGRQAASQFLIRVYSPCQLTEFSVAPRISKPFPMIENSFYGSDDRVKQLFEGVVQGNDGLDWGGLKEILNSNQRNFGVISSLLKYIKVVFEKYFNLRSPIDDDNSEVSFTKEECRRMIAMLDHDHSGKLSYPEFKSLWNKISFWRSVYEQHKEKRECHLNVAQLKDALGSMGYDVNKRTLHSLSYVYANDEGKICLTDFILCGVTLETVLSLAQKINGKVVNRMTLTLENWVRKTLNL